MAKRKPTNYGSYTDFNLNFGYGCAKVSEGCEHCYIDRYVNIKERTGLPDPFVGRFVPFKEEARLKELDTMPRGSVIFVNGLSDTFAPFVTDSQRDGWLKAMTARPWYDFMICTKRSGLMKVYFETHKIPRNVWVGTTIENRKALFRLPLLKSIEARVRWISFEPLLEDLGNVGLTDIKFCCLGGETDPQRRYREFKVEWGTSMLQNARRDGCKFWYDGGNGLNDSRSGAPHRSHRPNSGVLPQERFTEQMTLFEGSLEEGSQRPQTVGARKNVSPV